MSCGVYKIECVKTQRFYIGSSINVDKRIGIHFSKLRNNKHENIKLQRCFNKHPESFKWSLLKESNPCERLKLEQQFLINILKNPLCLNISTTAEAPMTGRKHSLATREAMKYSHKGRILSEKTKKLISQAKTGKKRVPFTKEWLKAMSVAQQQRKIQPTQGKHIWANRNHPMLGKTHSDVARKKMSYASSGPKHHNWKGGTSYNYKIKQKLNE